MNKQEVTIITPKGERTFDAFFNDNGTCYDLYQKPEEYDEEIKAWMEFSGMPLIEAEKQFIPEPYEPDWIDLDCIRSHERMEQRYLDNLVKAQS